MKKTLIESLGWLSTLAILVAYALVSFSIIRPTFWVYPFLNIVGSFGLIVHSLYKKDYQPVILNIVWIAVAIISIIRIFI